MVESTNPQIQMIGGHSDLKHCETGSEDHAFFETVKEALSLITDKKFDKFEVVGYTSQVVAGTIFQVKIRIAEGDTGFIHAKILRPLPHTGLAADIMAWETDRTSDSPFNFGQADVEMSEETHEEPKQEGMSISSMVNQQEVTMLMDMGFTKNVAEKALFLVQGGGVPKAMEWIEAHMDDPDF
jgi:hypothetical protein